MATANLTLPEYDEKKYREGTDTSYYQKAINDYKTDAEKNRATQIGDANKERTSALRNAYIQNMQNQQKLNKNLAMSGIRGGTTETANLNLANQYGQARGTANTNYSNSVNEINKNIDQNIRDYTSDMESRAEEYRQNLAQAKWQAAREDAMNMYNAQEELWNNYYMNRYSYYNKKNAKAALKSLTKKLNKAKTDAAKRRYRAAISGVTARLGQLANK